MKKQLLVTLKFSLPCLIYINTSGASRCRLLRLGSPWLRGGPILRRAALRLEDGGSPCNSVLAEIRPVVLLRGGVDDSVVRLSARLGRRELGGVHLAGLLLGMHRDTALLTGGQPNRLVADNSGMLLTVPVPQVEGVTAELDAAVRLPLDEEGRVVAGDFPQEVF